MGLSDPFRIRLARDHVEWLDSLRGGAITTRAQALRQVLDDAMRQHRKEEAQPQRRKTRQSPSAGL